MGIFDYTIWREHLLKISDSFFENLVGIPSVPKRRAKCTKGGRSPHPPFLWEKGAPANFLNTKIILSFLRYRYGKYRENTEGFIPKYRIDTTLVFMHEFHRVVYRVGIFRSVSVGISRYLGALVALAEFSKSS